MYLVCLLYYFYKQLAKKCKILWKIKNGNGLKEVYMPFGGDMLARILALYLYNLNNLLNHNLLGAYNVRVD